MSSKEPLISVIMSVYNREEYVAEAVESILGQTLADFEFIIVDDGSTDRSVEIVQQYAGQDQRIRFILNKTNLGLPACRNIGIKNALGKYLALMDSDDVSLPERFEGQTAYLDEHPQVWVLGTRVMKINAQGQPLKEWKLPENQYVIKWNSIFRNAGVVCNPSVMLRRELFTLVSEYDESAKSYEDLELWTRVFNFTEFWIRNLPEILLLYRVHDDSISGGNAYDLHSKPNEIRANLLSTFLQRKVDVIAISAYESRQPLNMADVNNIIPLWFETYRKFSRDFHLSRKEKCMIYQEILKRTPAYTSLIPFSKNMWVISFLPLLQPTHVFWMTLARIYNLLSEI